MHLPGLDVPRAPWQTALRPHVCLLSSSIAIRWFVFGELIEGVAGDLESLIVVSGEVLLGKDPQGGSGNWTYAQTTFRSEH